MKMNGESSRAGPVYVLDEDVASTCCVRCLVRVVSFGEVLPDGCLVLLSASRYSSMHANPTAGVVPYECKKVLQCYQRLAVRVSKRATCPKHCSGWKCEYMLPPLTVTASNFVLIALWCRGLRRLIVHKPSPRAARKTSSRRHVRRVADVELALKITICRTGSLLSFDFFKPDSLDVNINPWCTPPINLPVKIQTPTGEVHTFPSSLWARSTS